MQKIIAAALAFLLWLPAATAQELVHFPSLDGATQLDGYLYGPSGEGRRPAIVGLHGCSGMFSRATDASKVALVHLVARLRVGGFQLLDTQFVTEHLQRFGAIEIPRREYHARLAAALRRTAHFGLALPPESGGDPLVSLQSSTPTS